MKYIITIIVLILLGLGVWYFYQADDTTFLPGGGNMGESTEVDIATVDLDTAETFSISGRPYEYSIEKIVVQKGDVVVINFLSGQGLHDLRIDEFGVGTEALETGEKQMFAFVADKKGEFEYYCSVGNHRELGMVGTLIVE